MRWRTRVGCRYVVVGILRRHTRKGRGAPMKKAVHRLQERETTTEELREEVRRLRRDCDILGMQRTIDDLLLRVSRLEAQIDRLH